MFTKKCSLSPAAVIFLAALSGDAIAQDAWLPATGTGNCSVTDVDFVDATHAFAAGSFNCGLLSDDGGSSWSTIDVVPEHGQSLLWAHAETPEHLYAARIEFFSSSDGGETWTQLSDFTGQGGSFFDVHFHDASNLVAIRGGQILTSANGGVNWDIAYPGELNINFDELHFPDEQTGYATGGITRESGSIGTVLRSDDGGQTWTALDFAHGKITAADFLNVDHAMVATQYEGFFVTADGGQSWQSITNVPGGDYIDEIAHRSNQHWYAASLTGCMYETRDAGTSWQTTFCDPGQRALATMDVSGPSAVAAGNDGLVIRENRVFANGFENLAP